MSNFNLVLRTYAAMRQMSPDDLALLGTLRALNDTDREKLIETMSDKPQKKPGKKAAGKSASKSPRASGMAAAISNSLESSRKATMADGEDSCVKCSSRADDNIHHMATMKGYHPFVPPAQPADGPSSASGGATNSTASSGDVMGDALDAARAAAGE